MDGLAPLPAAASWRHRGGRSGFEVVFFASTPAGHGFTGRTTADDGETAWSLGYTVTVDRDWRTTEVSASASTAAGASRVHLTRDPRDGWAVDGEPRPELRGCVDVDFESSAMTNTFPLHRLDLRRGERVDVPAAFVRAPDLRVERLERAYTLTEASAEGLVFQYESSTFGFACELRYDAAGLVVDYPGIAVRHG